jgi:uncharacterized SAM-binding protein YcdF (DUF218 family)
MLGLESWKPILAALVLPPVPLLLLMLVGARLVLPRRGLGYFLVFLSTALLWLSACQGAGRWLQNFVLKPPPALYSDDLTRLKAEGRNRAPTTAIIVLGGGLIPRAPEYGVSDLGSASLMRLRYGLWLGRETGLPVGFSGGLGWAHIETSGRSEAEAAGRIAQQEYNRPLRWMEPDSRDTRENAIRTVALLRGSGVKEIVLVTHAYHMPRARKVFEEAAAGAFRITPAPMGSFVPTSRPVLDWLPSSRGYEQVSLVLHELLGLLVRA